MNTARWLEPFPPKQDHDPRLFHAGGRIITGSAVRRKMGSDANLTLWLAARSGQAYHFSFATIPETIMTRLIAVVLGLLFALSAAADDGAQVLAAKGKFADVKDDVVAAIGKRGLVVNYVAHVGDMLERTGRDLGRTKRIYDQAEGIEFWSGRLWRSMMEGDGQGLG